MGKEDGLTVGATVVGFGVGASVGHGPQVPNDKTFLTSLVATQIESGTPVMQKSTPLKGAPFTVAVQSTTTLHPKSSLVGDVEGAAVTGASVGGSVGGAVMGASVGMGVGARVVGAGVVGGAEGRKVAGHSPHSPIVMRPGIELLGEHVCSKAVPGISMQNSMPEPGPDPASHSMMALLGDRKSVV